MPANKTGRWKAIGGAGLLSMLLLISALAYLSRVERADSAAGSSQASGGGAPAIKLSVPGAGIYRLTQGELRLSGWAGDLNHPERIRLSNLGSDLPFFIENAGETPTIQFYGQPSSSLYNAENVYILQDEGVEGILGGSIEQSSPSPELPPPAPDGLTDGSYFASQREEQNKIYLPQAEGDERWFWLSLTAPVTHTVELNLQDVAEGTGNENLARLALSLYSSSEAPGSPDHQLQILINEQRVTEQSWDGKGMHQIETWFDHKLLQEGMNRVALVAPGVSGVTADISHLDWVEIGYARRLLAVDDRLDFWTQGGAASMSGFSGPVRVFDITDPWNAQLVGDLALDDGEAAMPSQPGHRYLAVGPGGYSAPEAIAPLLGLPDLRDPSIAAEYLAIAPAELLQALNPLLEHREGQGLSTAAIPVQAVYDQFSYGLRSPFAIRDFLSFAVESWKPAPRYLLLVGDASYDPKGYQSPGDPDWLVVPLVDTIYGGQTASDVPYVQINDDDWPDISVGLVPARTAEQVVTFVEKTLLYEKGVADQGSPGSVLAVADGFEPSFRWDAEAFLDVLSEDISYDLLTPGPGDTNTSSQIAEKLEAGVSLLAYFGHGSLNMWGKDRLFTVEDAAGLRNDRLPVVINMTCLTGLYTHPKVDSLAETLLFNSRGGAVAVLAPSSLTLAADQNFLSQPLIEGMLENPQASLGDLHLQARRQISLETAGMRDVMMTFMLFGDPALSLPHISPYP